MSTLGWSFGASHLVPPAAVESEHIPSYVTIYILISLILTTNFICKKRCNWVPGELDGPKEETFPRRWMENLSSSKVPPC
jgi:hypothetical protein